MQKSITYNQLLIQARLYLIRNTGNILGKRDYDVFDYDALTRPVFGDTRTFSWFLDRFEEHYPQVQAGHPVPGLGATQVASASAHS